MLTQRARQLALLLSVLFTFTAAFSAQSLFPRFSLLEPRRGGGHGGGGGGHSSGDSSGDSSSGTGTSSGTGSDTSSSSNTGTNPVSCLDSDLDNLSATNITTGTDDCVTNFGFGWEPCFTSCYNKAEGELCCAGNFRCSAGEYCGYGNYAYCCPTYTTPQQCASRFNVVAPPSNFQAGDANASGTATQYPSTAAATSQASRATCSSSPSSVSGGSSSGSSAGQASKASRVHTIDMVLLGVISSTSLAVLGLAWAL